MVLQVHSSVLATLEELENGEDRPRAIEATGIWTQVQTFMFLLSLITFWRLLSCTMSLSDQLQSTEMDLAKAADLVLTTISILGVIVSGITSSSMSRTLLIFMVSV